MGEPLTASLWWKVFDDPQLESLLHTAHEQNFDIAVAAERVAQAQIALTRIAAQQRPSADLSASVQRSGGDSSYSTTMNVGYQVDAWGAARARVWQGHSELQAAEMSHDVTSWRMAIAVAQLYYQQRALDERLNLALEGLAIAEDTFARVRARYDAGVISGLDLALIQTSVDTERSNVESIRLARDLAHNAMSVLLGRAPADVADSTWQSPALLELQPPALPQVEPVQAIVRRPDIQLLEIRLRAANANIEIARAELFPSIRIDADAVASGAGAVAYSIGSSLVHTIFDRDDRRAGVQLAESQYRELLYDYRAGILDALTEVENALTQAQRLRRREEFDRAALASKQRAYKLSELQYRHGLVDALTLQATQTSFLQARDALLQTRSEYLQALVAVYAGVAP